MKILIATGSSGGHLLPSVSLAEALRRQTVCDIQFLLAPPKNWGTPEALKPFRVHWMGSFAWPRKFSLEALLFPFKFLINTIRIKLLVFREKPNLVIGFGSFVSFPAVLTARFLGIPTLIVEQNRIFGKSNQFLSRFADQIALSFPLDKPLSSRFIVTGNPLRESIVKKAKNALYLEPKPTDKLGVLLVGGSQGARSLNRIFVETLKKLSGEELSHLRVTHLTGNSNYTEMAELYRDLPPSLERVVLPFSDQMEDLYSSHHLVIARAGAGSLSELTAFGRPSLLVPYPHAESHQLQNAKYLERNGACDVIEEKDLSSERLSSYLRELRQNPEKLKQMAEKAKSLCVLDGAERLSALALNLLSSQN